MADDGPISFILNLDSTQFMAAGEGALGLVKSIGDPSSMAGLLDTLGAATEALGVVALAAGAFKVALDMTIEGENIQRVENQFKSLADQAGISAEELKSAMVVAAGGLITTNQLLQDANKALLELGPSASSLPQMITLARQAVAVFGGDVNTTLNEMIQALANGNQKWLKHHGIVLDVNKAVRDYADANGIAENAISAAGKQQALFAAGMVAAQKRFAGVSTDIGQTTTALAAFKNAWAELTEFMDVVVSKVFGPTLTSVFDKLKASIHGATTFMVAHFGNGAEQTAAQTERLTTNIASLQKRIQELQTGTGRAVGIDPAAAKVQVMMLEAELKKYQGELEVLDKKKDVYSANDAKRLQENKVAAQAAQKEAAVDQQKLKENEAKFQAEKLKLGQEAEKEEVKNLNSLDQVDAQMKKLQLDRQKQHDAEIKKIHADTATDARQKEALVTAEDRRYAAQRKAAALDELKTREQYDAAYLKNAKSTFDGVGRAAQTTANKNRAELADFGKQGQQVYDGLSTVATSSFASIGTAIAQNQNVAQAAAAGMKKAFLGFIGETATHYGEMLLLQSIFPPNPVGIVAGGALIALGAALSSMAGSSAGGGVSTGAISGGGSSSGAASSMPTSSPPPSAQAAQLQQQQQVQRSVSVNIAGNYLNSQESQRTLMEMMRNETDASSFSYNKIGV